MTKELSAVVISILKLFATHNQREHLYLGLKLPLLHHYEQIQTVGPPYISNSCSRTLLGNLYGSVDNEVTPPVVTVS